MLAFADMMRKQIVMPAHLMDDGRHSSMNDGRNLFEDFSGGCEVGCGPVGVLAGPACMQAKGAVRAYPPARGACAPTLLAS